MGIAKRLWMEQIEDVHADERAYWIREQLDDDDADESHPEWDDLAEQFDSQKRNERFEYDDEWYVPGKTRKGLFDKGMSAVEEMLQVAVSPTTQKILYVMLHAHVVASVEAFLSSTFITVTLSDEKYIQRLVESDPEFAGRKFTLKEIFAKQASLKGDIAAYLKDLIFHKLEKVKEMYREVLSIDFGDLGWLFGAVIIRHDCVHRAGYTKDGDEVNLTADSIRDLVAKCTELVHRVDLEVENLPKGQLLTDF